MRGYVATGTWRLPAPLLPASPSLAPSLSHSLTSGERERERERERLKEGIGSGVGILNAIFFLFLRLLQMGNWPRRDKSGEEKKKTALDRCRICGLDRRRRRERRRQQQEEEAPKSAVSKAARKLLRSESFDRRRPQEQSTLSPPHSADPTDRDRALLLCDLVRKTSLKM